VVRRRRRRGRQAGGVRRSGEAGEHDGGGEDREPGAQARRRTARRAGCAARRGYRHATGSREQGDNRLVARRRIDRLDAPRQDPVHRVIVESQLSHCIP
jgi:hypothetical protein